MTVLRTEKQKDFRKEVSRLASMANKRIKRLAESDFSSSPAYQKWKKEGGKFFSIRGKSQADVWKEYYRVTDFINSKTSSITGTKKVLSNMNEYTGMKLDSVQDVQAVASEFFSLYTKVAEYIKVKGMGAIYDSNQVYKQIILSVEELETDLINADMSGLLDYIVDRIDDDYFSSQNDFNDLGRYKDLQ